MYISRILFLHKGEYNSDFAKLKARKVKERKLFYQAIALRLVTGPRGSIRSVFILGSSWILSTLTFADEIGNCRPDKAEKEYRDCDNSCDLPRAPRGVSSKEPDGSELNYPDLAISKRSRWRST